MAAWDGSENMEQPDSRGNEYTRHGEIQEVFALAIIWINLTDNITKTMCASKTEIHQTAGPKWRFNIANQHGGQKMVVQHGVKM